MDVDALVLGLVGGSLLGLAAGALLLLNGRLAGVSSIVGGLVKRGSAGVGWRAAFVLGLVVGGLILLAAYPQAYPERYESSPMALAGAGLLVGFGARLGGGCTSGHGVCGLGQLQRRSLIATLTFIGTGALAVLLVTRFFGGAI